MTTAAEHTVVVLGASTNRKRYSNRAVRMLTERNYHVVPVNPNCAEVEGLTCFSTLEEIKYDVDTLTVYVKPKISTALADRIVAVRPGRVILNPGTESSPLEKRLESEGIPVVKACTLVLLTTGQFLPQA